MPGKVNPVIPEVVNQVAFEVIGNDVTVTMAAEAGQLQLNAFEPIIAHSLFKSIDAPAQRLPDAGRALRRAASPPTASSCAAASSDSIGIVTALNPVHRLRATPPRSRRRRSPPASSVYDLVLEKKLLTRGAARRDPAARGADPAARVPCQGARGSPRVDQAKGTGGLREATAIPAARERIAVLRCAGVPYRAPQSRNPLALICLWHIKT